MPKIHITRQTFVAGVLATPGMVVEVDDKQAANLITSGKGEIAKAGQQKPGKTKKEREEDDDA